MKQPVFREYSKNYTCYIKVAEEVSLELFDFPAVLSMQTLHVKQTGFRNTL